MLFTTTWFLISVRLVIADVPSSEANANQSCVRLYEKGVEAYLDNDYRECVDNFEEAVRKYQSYKKVTNNCRLKCKQEADASEPLFRVDVENLLFYERAIKNTLCIMHCKSERTDIFNGTLMNFETEQLFEDQKPYEYLHICYFQTKDYQNAASAAFTYLVTHPNDKAMQGNLKHYTEVEGVKSNDIVNFEAKDFVYLYAHGADAYDKKDWKNVEYNMEESLGLYLQAEEECRANCEGPFDHGWYPDFIPSIANHFTMVLKCKMNCSEKMNSLNGEKHDDLLPSHYHYLQFAYFKMGNIKEACQAVASYLLFYPDDETMLDNMKYYRSLPKVDDEDFRPREEAVKYVQRKIYENKIMQFVNHEYRNIGVTPVDEETGSKQKVRIIMNGKQLRGGPKRFLAEGMASRKECKSLVEIARMFAVLGDGYKGKKSPHTEEEMFHGITLGRAAFLTYIGLLDAKRLEIYLRITENVRRQVERYFKLSDDLHFTYTHLVCRSALLADPAKNRTDFSHQIHADNCNILEDGVCERTAPAFFWRDYSAILYLNSNFEGGEFVFSNDLLGEDLQSSVEPKCGRMVAFSSGQENLHGVRAVRSGSRCSIGIWFTHNVTHLEKDRDLSYEMLDMLKNT